MQMLITHKKDRKEIPLASRQEAGIHSREQV
jgi:hypothetical protein